MSLLKQINDSFVDSFSDLKVESIDYAASAEQEACGESTSSCFGTFGSCGTAGGTFGCFGTYGCGS